MSHFFSYCSHDFHIIMDEVYGLSFWGEGNTGFKGVLSLKTIPDPQKTHFVWSFSKVSNFTLLFPPAVLKQTTDFILACWNFHFLDLALSGS